VQKASGELSIVMTKATWFPKWWVVLWFLKMELLLRNTNDNPNWNRFCNTTTNCVLGNTVQKFYEGFSLPLSRYHINLQGKYRGADKFLARPGRKQANFSVRMMWISFGALPCRGKRT